jgi:perosamine synthetase
VLHVALLAAGIEPNDEVLVATLNFIGPANAIRYAGAWPVFIDAESLTWQMDVHRLSSSSSAGGEMGHSSMQPRVDA